jgi:DNA-binding response OmpR family regulator
LILIVDDDPLSRKYLSALLASSGYEKPLTAQNASEAQHLAVSERPRLALIEMRLPGTSGFVLVRELRSREPTRSIRIIGISADVRGMIETAALDAGCDCYFGRPFDVPLLLDTVSTYLSDASLPSPACFTNRGQIP